MPDNQQSQAPVRAIDHPHLHSLHERFVSLTTELEKLRRREIAIDGERAAAESDVTTAVTTDAVEAAQSSIQRLDAELRAIKNRRPLVETQLSRASADVKAATDDADRRSTAAVIVALEPVAGKLLPVLDEIDAVRQAMVDAGAPEAVAAWHTGNPGNLDRRTNATLLELDKFRMWLEKVLLGEDLIEARRILEGGKEQQRFSSVPSIDADVAAAAGTRRSPAAAAPKPSGRAG